MYFCDGNEYEAVQCISNDRCGSCLKKTEPDERLYNLYAAKSYNYRDGLKDLDSQLAHTCLCASCFDEIAPKIFGEDVSGPEERRYIEE